MADRILYSIPEMKDAANNFKGKAEEINEILIFLNNEMQNLEPVFDGAAQDALFQKYDELQAQLKEFPEVIEAIGTLIEQIAIQAEESDQNMASSIG